MSIYIETERLYIRELQPEDVQGMFEMDSDPEVHHYVGQSPISTLDEASNVISIIRQQYEENGVGRWAVIEKDTDQFLGWTGFKLMREEANGHINHYDFGYRHPRKAWGKGIATEAAKATLQYGMEHMGLKPVFAMTDVNNAASRHILEKLGFRLVEIFEYTGPLHWRTPKDRKATWYEWGGNS